MTFVRALALVGEDALCCELGTKLVAKALPMWSVAPAPIDTGGVTNLITRIPRYSASARLGSPLLCIADSDRQCPVTWLNQSLNQKHRHARFMLRLAVPEAEGWVMADHHAMTKHFRAPPSKLPALPDSLGDAKRELMRLVHDHAPAQLRRDMIFRTRSGQLKRASGYNAQLQQFVADAWDPDRAAERSPSLVRALARLKAWHATMSPTPQ